MPEKYVVAECQIRLRKAEEATHGLQDLMSLDSAWGASRPAGRSDSGLGGGHDAQFFLQSLCILSSLGRVQLAHKDPRNTLKSACSARSP